MPVDLDALVRDIPDFPKPGIVFKDIMPSSPRPRGSTRRSAAWPTWRATCDVDVVIGAEARGFLLGPAIARELGAGFVLARKPGKLPHETVRAEYVLEYGTDALELHSDAVAAGARVLVHDDLLATGGHGQGPVRARRAARRAGGRVRLPHRARLPGRAREPGGLRRPRAAALRQRVDARPRAAAGRSPRRLSAFGRSWAIRTTCRAGGRRSRAWRPSTAEHFTEVLSTQDGRSLRADFRVVARGRRSAAPGSRSSREPRSSACSRAEHRGQAAARWRRDARDRRRAPAGPRLGAPGRLHGPSRDRARARRGARRPGGPAWAVRCAGGGGARTPTPAPSPSTALALAGGRLGTLDAPQRRGRARRGAPAGPAAARARARALRRRSCATIAPRACCTPRGKSYPDLVRQRAGDCSGAPDAVLTPRDHDEVRAVLEACARRAWPSCPSGAARAWSAASSRCARASARSSRSTSARSTRSRPLDERSQLAVVGGGMRAVELEARLGERGFTLGHYPQSYEYVTIGGCAATRSAGQASTGYGRIDELVVGRAAGGAGRRPRPARRSRRAPRAPSCAGSSSARRACWARSPGWRCGCARRPSSRRYEGWMFASFGAGAEALRRLEQGGAAPDVARLSDEEETRLGVGMAGLRGVRAGARRAYLRARGVAGGALAIVGWAGPEEGVRVRREAAIEALRDARRRGARAACGARVGALALPRPLRARRADGPRRDGRDARDRDDVGAALHPLPRGRRRPARPRAARWPATSRTSIRRARRCTSPSWRGRAAARSSSSGRRSRRRRARRSSRPAGRSPITTRSGATTRRTSRPRSAPTGVAALRALKRELDPAGVMNPGKLLPSA